MMGCGSRLVICMSSRRGNWNTISLFHPWVAWALFFVHDWVFCPPCRNAFLPRKCHVIVGEPPLQMAQL